MRCAAESMKEPNLRIRVNAHLAGGSVSVDPHGLHLRYVGLNEFPKPGHQHGIEGRLEIRRTSYIPGVNCETDQADSHEGLEVDIPRGMMQQLRAVGVRKCVRLRDARAVYLAHRIGPDLDSVDAAPCTIRICARQQAHGELVPREDMLDELAN